MSAAVLFRCVHQVRNVLFTQFRRNIGCTAVVTQKALDPIQELFLSRVREYGDRADENGLVEASEEDLTRLVNEKEKITRMYKADSPDFVSFPTFGFSDPVELEPVGINYVQPVEAAEEESAGADETDENTPYFLHPALA